MVSQCICIEGRCKNSISSETRFSKSLRPYRYMKEIQHLGVLQPFLEACCRDHSFRILDEKCTVSLGEPKYVWLCFFKERDLDNLKFLPYPIHNIFFIALIWKAQPSKSGFNSTLFLLRWIIFSSVLLCKLWLKPQSCKQFHTSGPIVQ